MNERCSGTCGKLPGEGVAVGLLVRDNFKLKIGRSMHWSCREVNYITVVQSIYVTGYGKTNHLRHFVETEINTPSERTFIADHNGAFIFSIGLSCAKL